MIRVMVANGTSGTLEGGSVGEIDGIPDSDHPLLWLDLDDPNEADLARVGKEFGLHPLAIEDAVRRHQRPKVDLYPDTVFIVFYALELEDGNPRTREISLFAGQQFLITTHEGALGVIEETARRWNEAVLKQIAAPSIGLLVYSLLDSIVDGYFPVMDELAERVDDLEMQIFSDDALQTHEELFNLKKDLLAVRRVVAPERDVMNVLVRRDAPLFSREEIAYLQDVQDHLLRITDSVDTYRDLLSSALDISVSMASFRLDETVKRMTSASIILMSMALISGIYGMNFVNMPELEWQWGYAYALGLMALIGGSLGWFFHRIDWL